MAKLTDLRQIVDEHLHGVVMTEEQKSSVRRRAAAHAQSASVPQRRWVAGGSLAVAACLLLAAVLSFGIPSWRVGGESGTSSGTPSADASSASSYASTFRASEGLLPLQELSVFASTGAAAGADGCVQTDTSFLICGASREDLAEHLSVSPEVSYSLSESPDGVVLTPSRDLSSGTVYNISIDSDSGELRTWAFQTSSAFSVVSTTPGSETIGAPVNTGIEITFSSPVRDAASGFSVTPAVEGRFEYDGYTVTFIPSRPLEANTLYTVTLAAGLSSESGDSLEQPYSFSFRTSVSVNDSWLYLADSFTESYLPGDPIVLSLEASEDITSVDVRVWALDSREEYLALAQEHEDAVHPAIGYSSDVLLDVPDGSPVLSFTGELTESEHDFWLSSLVFPDSLGNGWYLAELTAPDGLRVQKLISVCELAVYAETLNGDALVWVNSAATGTSVPGISVTLGGSSAMTDENGCARLSVGSRSREALTVGTVYADYIEVSPDETSPLCASYYTFLYTDRSAYLPTDELCFWGRLLPKSEGTALPDTLELHLDGVDDSPELTVSVASDGSFTGSLAFANLTSDIHDLCLAFDGEPVITSSLSVLDYTKPTYVLTLSADRSYYRSGETVTLTAHGTFYDGTPASGLSVQFEHVTDINGCYVSEPMTLDENGEAVYSFIPAEEAGSWYPNGIYMGVSTNGAEDVWVSAYAYVPYFRSDYMLEIENTGSEADGDTVLELHISTDSIDYDRYDPAAYAASVPEAEDLRGAPADMSVTCRIVRCEYVRTVTGQTYDAINKVFRDTYDYDYRETTEYETTLTTVGGRAVLPRRTLSHDGNAWYNIFVTAYAPDGAVLESELYQSGYGYPYYSDEDLCILRETTGNSSVSSPDVGDDMTYTLISGDDRITSGTMMISLWQDAFVSASVLPAGNYSMTVTEDILPNIVLSGAYFDGRHVRRIEQCPYTYLSRERELDVRIDVDSDIHAPGDTVTAEITVTDAGGLPVSAPFAVGIVDNAAFAVAEQSLDVLRELYAPVYTGRPLRTCSYSDHSGSSARDYAEGGGAGGGEGIRDDFKDTAAFFSGTTDSLGKATVSFTLPDNLTSWRLSAVCVSDSGGAVCGGSSARSITSTLPCFLNVVYSDTYLTGDDISCTVRVTGADEPVELEAVLAGSGISLERRLTSSSRMSFVSFGAVDPGVYTLTVRTLSGENRDAVSYTIRVVESRAEIASTAFFDLSQGANLSSLRYPVQLTFCDAHDRTVLRALSRASVSGTRRLDGALAGIRYAALFEGEDAVPADLSEFCSADGGLRILPYADSTAETTAWALLAGRKYLNSDSARSYLYGVLYDRDSSSREVAAAYLGLAALHEPVLADARLLLRSGNGTELSDELTLAAALAVLGDCDSALEWYSAHEDALGHAGDSDEAFEYSLYALILNAACGRYAQAEALFEEILASSCERVSPAFALLAYLQYLPESETADASFTYTLGGNVHTVHFNEAGFFTLTLSESELEGADFRVLSGQVFCAARYVAPLAETGSAASGFSVTQSYSPTSGGFTVGGSGVLEVSVLLPEGADSATVSVVLPAGLRYAGIDSGTGWKNWYAAGEEDGRITLRFVRDAGSASAQQITAQLRVRCVLPGFFRAEPCVLTDDESGEILTSSPSSVTIR